MRTLCLFPLLLLLGGCPLAECDDSQVLANGGCFVVEPDAAPGPDAGDGDGGADAGDVQRLGLSCTATGQECGGDADFCAVEPGKTDGFCTRTGCKTQPTLCPDGWICLDLSIFDPTLPSLCTPAST